jgi:hypothetical protein
MLNFARYTADSHLTSSLLQHGDVRREDILSCIDVTITDRSARSALHQVGQIDSQTRHRALEDRTDGRFLGGSTAGHPYSL